MAVEAQRKEKGLRLKVEAAQAETLAEQKRTRRNLYFAEVNMSRLAGAAGDVVRQAELLGHWRTPDDRFAIVSPGRCRGGMAAPAPIMGSAPPAARVRGRLLERPGNRARLEVVIADASGVIRGLGIGRASDGAQGAPGIRWSGYLAAFDPSEQYTAYAVLGDGHSACRLRGSAE